MVISARGKYFVDFGINHLIPYYGKSKIGKRVTAQFKKGFPELQIKEIVDDEYFRILGL